MPPGSTGGLLVTLPSELVGGRGLPPVFRDMLFPKTWPLEDVLQKRHVSAPRAQFAMCLGNNPDKHHLGSRQPPSLEPAKGSCPFKP
jgi:hypothetical protein